MTISSEPLGMIQRLDAPIFPINILLAPRDRYHPEALSGNVEPTFDRMAYLAKSAFDSLKVTESFVVAAYSFHGI